MTEYVSSVREELKVRCAVKRASQIQRSRRTSGRHPCALRLIAAWQDDDEDLSLWKKWIFR